MPHWSNKSSELKHMSRADENGTCTNDCRGKPNTAERWAEFIRVASVSIVSVLEQIGGWT